jgi:hypothetical protein
VTERCNASPPECAPADAPAVHVLSEYGVVCWARRLVGVEARRGISCAGEDGREWEQDSKRWGVLWPPYVYYILWRGNDLCQRAWSSPHPTSCSLVWSRVLLALVFLGVTQCVSRIFACAVQGKLVAQSSHLTVVALNHPLVPYAVPGVSGSLPPLPEPPVVVGPLPTIDTFRASFQLHFIGKPMSVHLLGA